MAARPGGGAGRRTGGPDGRPPAGQVAGADHPARPAAGTGHGRVQGHLPATRRAGRLGGGRRRPAHRSRGRHLDHGPHLPPRRRGRRFHLRRARAARVPAVRQHLPDPHRADPRRAHRGRTPDRPALGSPGRAHRAGRHGRHRPLRRGNHAEVAVPAGLHGGAQRRPAGPAGQRVRRSFLRRPLPDLRHPRRAPRPGHRAALLLRPRVESRPPGTHPYGWAPETLLESYHTERRAAAEEILAVTAATMDFLFPPDESAPASAPTSSPPR